jgi:hypothetical protein
LALAEPIINAKARTIELSERKRACFAQTEAMRRHDEHELWCPYLGVQDSRKPNGTYHGVDSFEYGKHHDRRTGEFLRLFIVSLSKRRAKTQSGLTEDSE